MPEANLILIVEDDEALRHLLVDILESEGFKTQEATTAEEALKMVYEHLPHLIILDLILPGINGYEFSQKLKQDVMLRHIPIIMLSAKTGYEDELRGLAVGADDYVKKPFDPDSLLARIKLNLRRAYLEMDLNPLTRLPGNTSIIKRTEEFIRQDSIFAILFIDLNNFKSFNDEYGFSRGDEVIRFTAGLLGDVIKGFQDADDFIGHLGGDDFVIITKPQKVDKICPLIIERFDSAIGQFYDEEARQAGGIIKPDRQGNLIKFPLMTISVGVVTNEKRKLTHIGQIDRIARELRDYVKSFPGSIYFKDRRSAPLVDYEGILEGVAKRMDERKQKMQILKEIINQQNIKILFQPIIEFNSKTIIGYEALARGPKGSDLEYPDVLFTLAREADMLWDLDRLCQKSIMSFAKDFSNGLRLFVNICPESIFDPELRQLKLLEGNPMSPQDLVLEITERGMRKDFDKFYEILRYIKERSVKIAIDDAGSGYVSLRDVAKLKPDYIKMDISLVRNIDKDKLRQDVLLTLFSFSQRIGSTLIAEGVETEAEYNFLVSMGIRLGQGYFFAKPGEPYPKLNEGVIKNT